MQNVAVLALEPVTPFELGAACEAFGLDRSDDGVPLLDFAVCGTRTGTMVTTQGFELSVRYGLDRVAQADLVVVPARGSQPSPPAALSALRAAIDRGARVLSLCSGAFTLGEAGLLDGRDCTTHWKFAAELASAFPRARVDPDVLYVDADPVITSAGTAAGLDACLHLWRKDFGPEIAATIARRMVVPPHRDGGQAQFVPTPLPRIQADNLAPVLDWARQNLAEELSVKQLAERATMSTRTFARKFRQSTGTTPHQWVLTERLTAAERLLESTDASIEEISRTVGFGPSSALRHHFTRSRRTTPTAFRARFRCLPE